MHAEAKRLHDEALKLKPEGAKHEAQTCPFCIEAASSTGAPSGSDRPVAEDTDQRPDEASEGGTNKQMDTITLETHERKVQEAVAAATASKDTEIATLTTALERKTAEVTEQASQLSTLTEENARLNGELDKSQIALKASGDELSSLKGDLAKRDADAAKAEVASTRAAQVKALGIFDEKFVADSASRWAEMGEDDWASRVAEWTAIKGGGQTPEAPTTDAASALTGTTESQEEAAGTGGKTDNRRAGRVALGLN